MQLLISQQIILINEQVKPLHKSLAESVVKFNTQHW